MLVPHRWFLSLSLPFRALLAVCRIAVCAMPFAVRGAPLPPPTPLVGLSSGAPCSQCRGVALPGGRAAHPETKWGIVSDLPESFEGYGVLYSTRPVLPGGERAPELARQRRAGGFRTIDGGFDVFLFHLNKTSSSTQRLIVFVENRGQAPVTLKPLQVIKSEGTIGRVHEFESTLGARVLSGDWDHPLGQVTVAPGEGRVAAFGKNFGDGAVDGPDSSRNVNTFGYARVEVESAGGAPDLEVSVMAIPAGELAGMEELAERWKGSAAKSTDEVGMQTAPQGCNLGRAVGVYPNFVWRSDPVVVDVRALGEEGLVFPMALPEVQTAGCPEARQTQDLALYPGYSRPETVGNYMIETEVRFTLTNPGETTATVDLRFGKRDADVGLAYSVETTESLEGQWEFGDEVRTLWAGPKQSAAEKSLLEKPMQVAPGGGVRVALRYLILGNSSLPFELKLTAAKPR